MSEYEHHQQREQPAQHQQREQPAQTPYGLIGRSLKHSHSPRIHGCLGSAPYRLIELATDADVRAFFAQRDFTGVNVTIPYKKLALSCCDQLSAEARRLGNVNTVCRRSDGSLYGSNTDYFGFDYLLRRHMTDADLQGAVCLVLGDGAASHTVQCVLEDAGAARVLVAGRKPRADRTAGHISYEELAENPELRAAVSLIVNATPVGMYPHAQDNLLVDLDGYPALRCVLDIVYNPLKTRLVQATLDRGLAAEGGLAMLVAQAFKASELFMDCSHPQSLMDQVLQRLTADLMNIVLIGMPGSGKTRVGQHLAQLLGKSFVDIDHEIVATSGLPVPDIFARDGEKGFRTLETQCTRSVCARGGQVVATGGGVVTRPENRWALHSNALVVLLLRGLDGFSGEKLPSNGRPLSAAKGLDTLRKERSASYHAWADLYAEPDDRGAAFVAAHLAEQLSPEALLTWMSAAGGSCSTVKES